MYCRDIRAPELEQNRPALSATGCYCRTPRPGVPVAVGEISSESGDAMGVNVEYNSAKVYVVLGRPLAA